MNNVIPLFSVPVYKTNLESLDVEIDYFKKLKFTRIQNGFMSEDKYVLEKNHISNVKKIILKHVNHFAFDVLRISDSVDFVITNSWLTLHHKGDWAHKHNHKNSLISGILYLSVDELSGSIVFHSDDRKNILNQFFDFNTIDYNIFNSSNWIEKPINNDLFIFPSFLEHSVTESHSINDRLALVFNVFIKGKIGESKLVNELFL